MPKMKTHKGTKKRFKITGSGKAVHKRVGSSHLMSHKNGKRVRNLRRPGILIIEAESARIRKALGVRKRRVSPKRLAELEMLKARAAARLEESGESPGTLRSDAVPQADAPASE